MARTAERHIAGHVNSCNKVSSLFPDSKTALSLASLAAALLAFALAEPLPSGVALGAGVACVSLFESFSLDSRTLLAFWAFFAAASFLRLPPEDSLWQPQLELDSDDVPLDAPDSESLLLSDSAAAWAF